MGKFFFALSVALVLLNGRAVAAPESPPNAVRSAPKKNWEIDFEAGILWRAGHNGTYLNYTLLPQILTWKTAPVLRHAVAGGELTMRSRFSLLHESIIKGPENHFTAVTASGLL